MIICSTYNILDIMKGHGRHSWFVLLVVLDLWWKK